VIVEDTILLEGSERFQVMESKCKEVTSRDEKGHRPPKKAKERQQGKYHGGTAVKMGGANLCERCVSTRQDCLVYPSR